MGVHGLWRLIEPSGKPVPLESLENKVLAVDISIWLHQAVKGFQDSKGASLPNAHLLGIFHRLCKLLYFRIKPVFVFDGGVPVLKKQTIAKRNQLKSKNTNEANRIQKQLINTLLKHSAVNKVIVENVKANLENAKKQTDMFELPPSQFDATSSSGESESESSLDTSQSSSPSKTWDLHTIDEKSSHFKSLPADVRHEILTELKETRKQNSWGRIHELPTQSDDFSGYQMKRLLKRYSIQVSLEEAEKEMGGASLSLGELESLLKDHGVLNKKDVGARIASDENKRFFLIKNTKKALAEGVTNDGSNENKIIVEEDEPCNEDLEKAIQLSLQDIPSTSTNLENETQHPAEDQNNRTKTVADIEYEQDLEIAIQLSLQGTNQSTRGNLINNYVDDDLFISDSDDNSNSSDVESNTKANQILASVKNYMTEYSGLTPSEISKIMSGDNTSKNVHKQPTDAISKLETETTKDINITIQDKFNDFKKPQLSKLLSSKPQITESSKVAALSDLPAIRDTQNSNEKSIKSISDVVELISDDETPEEIVEENDKLGHSEAEKVELISDNSDSDSDFLEVTSKTDTEKDKSEFEIMIQKNAKLDDTDDIFSDIFSVTKEVEVNKETTPQNVNQTSTGDQQAKSSESEKVSIVTEHTDVTKDTLLLKDVPSKDGSNQLLNEVLSTVNAESAKQLSNEELKTIEVQLNEEKNELLAKQSLKERLATNITEQMRTEAQELLQLFGIPYIIAPMEAEAQCAFLDIINLTDGTITDDSDIWLFGGETVYKNFFNQSRRVVEFKVESIQHSFKLSRYEMILLALLVGSDYTTGVQGVGPVTALEILAHFPAKKQKDLDLTQDRLISGLVEFKRWIKGEYNIKGRVTLRSKLKNILLNDQFPSLQVVNAYLEPSVEASEENFTWGKPELVSLLDYAKEKFGWDQKKSEGILKPVFKSLEQNNVQSKITNYFKTKHKIQGALDDERMSKRVKTALGKIGKSSTSSDEDTTKANDTKSKNKKTKKIKPSTSKAEKPSTSKTKKPSTSKTEKPSTSKTEKPSTSKTEKPSTSKIEKPSTSKTEKPTTSQPTNNQKETSSLPLDDDLKMLQQTKKVSRKRAKQIENELRYEMEQKELAAASSKIEDPKTTFKRKLHAAEVIPQKQKDKSDALRTKMKAIETFRKSKQGPGYVKKRAKKSNLPKDDAHLSEDSDS